MNLPRELFRDNKTNAAKRPMPRPVANLCLVTLFAFPADAAPRFTHGTTPWCTDTTQLLYGSWQNVSAGASLDKLSTRYQCHVRVRPSKEVEAPVHSSHFEFNEPDRNPLNECLNTLHLEYRAASHCNAQMRWGDIGSWALIQQPIMFVGDSLTRHLFEDFVCSLQATAGLDVWLTKLARGRAAQSAPCKGWYAACGATDIQVEVRARSPTSTSATGSLSFTAISSLDAQTTGTVGNLIRANAPRVVVVGSVKAHNQKQNWAAYEQDLAAALHLWRNASSSGRVYVLPPPPAHFATPDGLYSQGKVQPKSNDVVADEPADDACVPLSENNQVDATAAHVDRLRAVMQAEQNLTVLPILVNRTWPIHLLHPRWLPQPGRGKSNQTTYVADCLHYCVSGDGRTGWNQFVNLLWLGAALGIYSQGTPV
jgi:hypothetical protein